MIWDNERIKELRHKLDFTQTEFAEILGCRQQTISEWEQGLYLPGNAYGKLLDQLSQEVSVDSPPKAKLQTSLQISKEGAVSLAQTVVSQYLVPEIHELIIDERFVEDQKPFDPAID